MDSPSIFRAESTGRAEHSPFVELSRERPATHSRGPAARPRGPAESVRDTIDVSPEAREAAHRHGLIDHQDHDGAHPGEASENEDGGGLATERSGSSLTLSEMFYRPRTQLESTCPRTMSNS